jgi:hypothetical protein
MVRQNKRWVVGPYGITQATEYRKSGDFWSLKQLFKEELPDNLIGEFMQRANWIPNHKARIDVSSESDREYLLQIVLTYGKDSEILAIFNGMIADKILDIKTIRTYAWNIVGTPCGIFLKEYDGVEKLSSILVKECGNEDYPYQLSQRKLLLTRY